MNAKLVNKAKRLLIGAFLSLALLHIASVLIDRGSANGWLGTAAPWFDLDREYVVPSVYTGLLLALCSVSSVILAVRQKPHNRKIVWGLLAAIFAYLSLDEVFIIHEQLAEPLRDLLSIGPGSLLYHAWVVPALAITGLGIVATATAVKHHLVSATQAIVISLLMMLVILNIAIESLGTKVYSSPLGYRLGAVMLEELFEIGMISYILYRLVNFSSLAPLKVQK